MRISVVGSGYVGLTTAICLASSKNQVVCVDIDKIKVDQINKGKLPFYEDGLENRLAYCVNGGNCLKATSDYRDIIDSTITFVCVGTPCNYYGDIDLMNIRQSVREIGHVLEEEKNQPTIVIRSTVVPGTTEKVIIPDLEELSGKKSSRDFSVAFNPEFLQEGRALYSFTNPDKIVIGAQDHRAGDVLEALFRDTAAPIIKTDITTAEMIKFASNAFLATKISFINEIGNICKKFGIDVYEIARAIGYDPRIGDKFLNAGIGFGGSCLPKDVLAMIYSAEERGYGADLLRAVLNTNMAQLSNLIEIVKKNLGSLEGKIVTVLGLAFKPNTDDIRQAPALQIINQLLEKGALVKVYDPLVKPSIKFPGSDHIEFCANTSMAITGSDCVIIATEWDEFMNENLYAGKVVIDGRRALDPKKARQVCQYYEGVCW